MGVIQVEHMEFYAYHGHFDDEQVVGNQFLVNVKIDTDCEKAALSDKLEDALDYQKVYLIVKEEMSIPSKLLEHLAKRILDRFYQTFNTIDKASVKIQKMNPPMGGKIGSVSVSMER